MTRGQLRSVVRYEALVISLFGAIEGLVLGTALGCAIVAAMRSSGINQLTIPVSKLLLLTATRQ
jgi:putative ABC transport system permease protein